ncbi:MAG: aminopeptidase P N-terminal domain-containing protein [Acidimicrobiia bacterium]|nr:aminopeptidase P N-terminal domain-containing protein [Acidimicrobiia bacterium]
MDQFLERRTQLAGHIGEGIAVIPAARQTPRNDDVDHEFRQNSNFYFLTGFDEPDAVAVIDPSHPSERYVLFVRPRDREMEIWNGYRAGVEGAVAGYGADAAYPIAELDTHLKDALIGRRELFYGLGGPLDSQLLPMIRSLQPLRERYGRVLPSIVHDPTPILEEMRLRKTPSEAAHLRTAAGISVRGHVAAMRHAGPGTHEFQVQAVMEAVFRQEGSPRNGYPSIVASGPNACILHYTENRRRMDAGDLLLIDAAAESGYFSADITRTFPVNGTFTAPQRAVYEVVLAAHQAAIAVGVPGRTHGDMHDVARRTLTEGLVDLGLLPRGVQDSLAMHHYREYFMHGTGHWLGMDVHDAGTNATEEGSRLIEPGMAFTVEPGIYIDPAGTDVEFALVEYDHDALMERRYRIGSDPARKLEAEERAGAPTVRHVIPEEFRGIGVRIEDDILATYDGNENLTAALPVAADDVEALCRS